MIIGNPIFPVLFINLSGIRMPIQHLDRFRADKTIYIYLTTQLIDCPLQISYSRISTGIYIKIEIELPDHRIIDLSRPRRLPKLLSVNLLCPLRCKLLQIFHCRFHTDMLFRKCVPRARRYTVVGRSASVITAVDISPFAFQNFGYLILKTARFLVCPPTFQLLLTEGTFSRTIFKSGTGTGRIGYNKCT